MLSFKYGAKPTLTRVKCLGAKNRKLTAKTPTKRQKRVFDRCSTLDLTLSAEKT